MQRDPVQRLSLPSKSTSFLSVAHGWVSHLGRLSEGTHELVIHVVGTLFGDPIDFTNTTTIIVTKR